MRDFPSQNKFKNLLLRALSPDDFATIVQHLTPVDLPTRKRLVEPEVPIQTAWFLEVGVASVVTISPEGHQSESGFVGRCGVVDIATILGSDVSPLQCYVQVPGNGHSIPISALRQISQSNQGISQVLLRYVQALFVQVAHTALSNASHGVEERLARWLLMCFDRVDGNEVPLTHEFLSLMLNVRRAGVTMALASLANAGFISTRRGTVILHDLAGLRDLASDSYGAPETEYKRLIGQQLARSG